MEFNKPITKESFLESLSFATPSGKSRSRSSADISITKNVGNKLKDGSRGAYKFNIIFRNGSSEIVSNTDFIKFAPFKNRLIFVAAENSSDGFKLSQSTTTSCESKYMKVSQSKDLKYLDDFIGDYQLMYDSFYELYYIEKEK